MRPADLMLGKLMVPLPPEPNTGWNVACRMKRHPVVVARASAEVFARAVVFGFKTRRSWQKWL